jgi:predicted MFS family arabinose efflux permease
MDAWFGGYRSALSHRDLRYLFSGLITSQTGSWAFRAALFGYMYERTHSLVWVSAAGLVRFIPTLLFSTYGGVIAERTERVRLMVSADLICGAWQCLLVVVAATKGPVVLALALAALTEVTNIVYEPSVAATIPAIVGEDDLVAANALNGLIYNLVTFVGPAVGALLLLIGTGAVVFGFNAGTFFVSALLVSRMRIRSRPVDVTEEGRVGPLRQMAVGARTIINLPAARTLVAYCALVSGIYGTDTVLFISVSEHKLGLGPEGFGYLLAGMGIGGILMAGAVDRISRAAKLGPIIFAGTAGFALPTILLIFIHNPAPAIALEMFRGAATLVVDVMAITALQRSVPSDQLARVFGVFFAFVLGAISLGALITPPIVNGLGLDAALLVIPLGSFAIGLAGYPALMRMDREAAAKAAALAPKVAILEQLGIFATASRAVLERLAGAEVEETFEPVTTIISEGDPAEALYVLTEGEVEVLAHGEAGGPDRRIRVMTAPTYFGEIGVLEKIPRTATVVALTQCTCERIDGDTLLEALTAAPPSTALMENARSRLGVTHPSREVTYAPPELSEV